jgi:hypothetical protein
MSKRRGRTCITSKSPAVMDIGGAPWIMAAWVTHSAKGGCFLRSEPAYILPASLSDIIPLQ